MSENAAIENWWPRLDVDSKHEILRDLDAPLSPRVAHAISGLGAATVNGDDEDGDGAADMYLSERDKDFIRTQMEAVD